MGAGYHITDKRTVISARSERSPLDADGTASKVGAMIQGIKFISIPVRDQKRALDFYTEKLGFTIITDQPFSPAQRWIELRIPKAETRVTLFTPEGHESRIGTFTGISFWTDDVEASYVELLARGVAPTIAPAGDAHQ